MLSQVQWAQHAGLRQYSVSYSSPADAYDSNNGHSSQSVRRPWRRDGRSRRDGWTQYFERVEALRPSSPEPLIAARTMTEGGGRLQAQKRDRSSSARLLRLDCAGGARAWEQYANYAVTWAEATQQRAHRIELVRTLPLRPRKEYLRQAQAFWTSQFDANQTVLGVHLRGTDKQFAVGVAPYLPLIAAFLCHRPGAAIFVATDDWRMLAQLRAIAASRWPRTRLVAREVARGSQTASGRVGLNPGFHVSSRRVVISEAALADDT